MKKIPVTFMIITLNFFCLFNGSLIADDVSGNESEFIMFPAGGVQLDGKILKKNKSGHRMISSRVIDFDLFRYKKVVLSVFVNETITYDDSGSAYIYPYSIRYDMDYGILGWKFPYGKLSVFFDHICTNIYNTENTDLLQLRWYGGGLRWETYGVRPGRKNTGTGLRGTNAFTPLNSINYKLSAGKSFDTRNFQYDYLVSGSIRYDLFRYYSAVPYMEGSFTSFLNDSVRWDRSIETGIRIGLDAADISVYGSYSYKHQPDYNNEKRTGYYLIGLRLEAAVGNSETESSPGTVRDVVLPEFHFSGSYGKYLNDGNLNYNTDMLISFIILKVNNISAYTSGRIIHSSLIENSGMFPRYIQNGIESGISLNSINYNPVLDFYYRYHRYDETNFYNGFTRQYHLAGLRLSSRGMKTGRFNEGININEEKTFRWLNRINWMVSAGRIAKEQHYDYDLEYSFSLRWDLFRYSLIIPYLSGGVDVHSRGSFDNIYFVETGLRINNNIYWMLYYRYNYRTLEDPDNGLYRNYHLAGLRIEI